VASACKDWAGRLLKENHCCRKTASAAHAPHSSSGLVKLGLNQNDAEIMDFQHLPRRGFRQSLRRGDATRGPGVPLCVKLTRHMPGATLFPPGQSG